MRTDISDARSVSTAHRRCKMPQKCTFRTFDVPCKETAKTIVIRSRVRSRNAFFRMRGRYRPHIAGASLINTQNSNKLHLFYFFFLFRACVFCRNCFSSQGAACEACFVRCRPSPAEGCGLRVSFETQTFRPNHFRSKSPLPSSSAAL